MSTFMSKQKINKNLCNLFGKEQCNQKREKKRTNQKKGNQTKNFINFNFFFGFLINVNENEKFHFIKRVFFMNPRNQR